MRWYTAIGMKKDDADGRFCVWVDGEEKVLTEMETILWAAQTGYRSALKRFVT